MKRVPRATVTWTISGGNEAAFTNVESLIGGIVTFLFKAQPAITGHCSQLYLTLNPSNFFLLLFETLCGTLQSHAAWILHSASSCCCLVSLISLWERDSEAGRVTGSVGCREGLSAGGGQYLCCVLQMVSEKVSNKPPLVCSTPSGAAGPRAHCSERWIILVLFKCKTLFVRVQGFFFPVLTKAFCNRREPNSNASFSHTHCHSPLLADSFCSLFSCLFTFGSNFPIKKKICVKRMQHMLEKLTSSAPSHLTVMLLYSGKYC